MYAALSRVPRAAPAAAAAAAAVAFAYNREKMLIKAEKSQSQESPAPAPQVKVEPTELHLIQAQVLFRHGHRAPVHTHHLIDSSSQGWSAPPVMPEASPSVAMRNCIVSARHSVTSDVALLRCLLHCG